MGDEALLLYISSMSAVAGVSVLISAKPIVEIMDKLHLLWFVSKRTYVMMVRLSGAVMVFTAVMIGKQLIQVAYHHT